ncbi:ABC transporter ATP-binding protein [Caulobacter sp. S45]|uniref:ABC transporter ATP-binding protein n=1 Tax=Caulobacter sp. S45 TaxID=1641861 RepID=UPI001575E849|nr:ATP-binding cassette domain-containing protein [Caulobacter sp. S45]
MSAALELVGVTKRYGDFSAVHELSFAIEPGCIFGFLGPNGAGKTTTLRMVLGLIPPSAGEIVVLGGRGDLPTVRDRIGFLPEERGLYRRMTPLEAVIFFAGLKGVTAATARRRGVELLEAQGLGQALHRPMKALSKGMAQKVQLICAIAHEPELVILDEPFSGLDPVNQQGLEGLIRSLAQRGATVIFSTHVMAHAERLCRRVALMARGRKVFDGTVEAACSAVPQRIVMEGAVSPAQLQALPGVFAVDEAVDAHSGRRMLTATLAGGAEPQAALRAAFQRELDVTQFRVEAPTLHDAFIVLTGGVA